MIDISPDQMKIVRAILNRHVPGREVWIFGSRANGTAKKFSDLDLAIIRTAPVPGTMAIIEHEFVGYPVGL